MGGFFYSSTVNLLADGSVVSYKEGAFTSDETKPTGTAAADIASGSIIVEPDTGSVFFYDRTNDEWVEQFSFQS